MSASRAIPALMPGKDRARAMISRDSEASMVTFTNPHSARVRRLVGSEHLQPQFVFLFDMPPVAGAYRNAMLSGSHCNDGIIPSLHFKVLSPSFMRLRTSTTVYSLIIPL